MLYQTHTPSAMNDVLTFYLYLAFSTVLQNAGILNCTPKAIKVSNKKEDQTEKLVPWGTDGRLPLSDRDLGSGHTAYRRASLIDLYLHTKFH